MPPRSAALGREKALPDIPIDIDATMAVIEDEGPWLIPPSKLRTFATTNKPLPSIMVEHTLSEEDMNRLHDLWNGAGLSARAHRRRQRGRNAAPCRIPNPICIPGPENVDILPTLLSAGPSTTSTIPSATGTRKRWGFFSARPFTETQGGEKKAPNPLGALRMKAHDRLKRKLRYAKSAPNLGDQVVPSERGVTLQPVLPRFVGGASEDVKTGGCSVVSSPGETAVPEAVLQPEDVDENAIYFTIDPNWRVSQGSVQFQFIRPVPECTASLGKPDSPLLDRHQLSFAEREVIDESTTTEFHEAHYDPNDKVLHLIDELHTYLKL